MLTPTLVTLKWEPVVGATGWEILVDGQKIATAGRRHGRRGWGEDRREDGDGR